jgi:hypothetical protein
MMPTAWSTAVVIIPFAAALGACLREWRWRELAAATGMPAVGASSVATAVTGFGALLNVLGATVQKNQTTLLNSQEYLLLGVLFPALVALSVLLFALVTSGGTGSKVLLFLTTVIVLWAALAESALIILQLYELSNSRVLSVWSAACFGFVPTALVPALFVRLRNFVKSDAKAPAQMLGTEEQKRPSRWSLL